MTGLCHQSSAAIDEAATWLAKDIRESISRPLVPHLKATFGLSTSEAIEAIRAATLKREAADANP